MAKSPWTMVLEENDAAFQISSSKLSDLLLDIPSCWSFLEMLCTGTPAEVKLIRHDGNVSLCRVVPSDDLGPNPTYANPYG